MSLSGTLSSGNSLAPFGVVVASLWRRYGTVWHVAQCCHASASRYLAAAWQHCRGLPALFFIFTISSFTITFLRIHSSLCILSCLLCTVYGCRTVFTVSFQCTLIIFFSFSFLYSSFVRTLITYLYLQFLAVVDDVVFFLGHVVSTNNANVMLNWL